jgi:hypothetical protein
MKFTPVTTLYQKMSGQFGKNDSEDAGPRPMLERAESIREARPARKTNGATYTVTFGSCNIGALQQPKTPPSPECYVCSYAHYRKFCPLLRCPCCKMWGHSRINCPSKPAQRTSSCPFLPSPGQLKRAEALLFTPRVHSVRVNISSEANESKEKT